jgi:hypothetical protein
MTIWSILRPLEIFYGHLVYFVLIWYNFPRFGIFDREKSGNPDRAFHLNMTGEAAKISDEKGSFSSQIGGPQMDPTCMYIVTKVWVQKKTKNLNGIGTPNYAGQFTGQR